MSFSCKTVAHFISCTSKEFLANSKDCTVHAPMEANLKGETNLVM